MQLNNILIRPKITEKALKEVSRSVYAFQVNIHSNKNQIKDAVEQIFKVKVSEIKTVVKKGKQRRVGRKMKTKRLANTKIAYVKLKSGKIDLFPQN